LQQSEAQQLEPSVQQLVSALHALPSLQHEAAAFIVLHMVREVFVLVSAVVYTTPASMRISVTTIALKDFIIESPVGSEYFG
jgi:hypothetical protein